MDLNSDLEIGSRMQCTHNSLPILLSIVTSFKHYELSRGDGCAILRRLFDNILIQGVHPRLRRVLSIYNR